MRCGKPNAGSAGGAQRGWDYPCPPVCKSFSRSRLSIIHHQSSLISDRGFTLIELLAVIAIIALLMAILLPALQRVRKQAKALTCRANLKQWGMILALYTEDSQGRFPDAISSGIWLLRGSILDANDTNKPGIDQPVSGKGIACCPAAVKPGNNGTFSASVSHAGSMEWHLEGTGGSTFEAWQLTSPGPPFRSSYGFNEWLFSTRFSGLMSPNWLGPDAFSVRGKANIPVLLDCANPGNRPDARDRPPMSEDHGVGRMGVFCMNRHEGHTNGLFLDWSVRRVGLKELWTLKWYMDFDTAGRWTKAGGVKPEDWPEWMRAFKDY